MSSMYVTCSFVDYVQKHGTIVTHMYMYSVQVYIGPNDTYTYAHVYVRMYTQACDHITAHTRATCIHSWVLEDGTVYI